VSDDNLRYRPCPLCNPGPVAFDEVVACVLCGGTRFVPDSARTCRVCGCTDDDCRRCIEKTGRPCHWVDSDLCSACEGPPKKGGRS
jgi:hypothetical protein